MSHRRHAIHFIVGCAAVLLLLGNLPGCGRNKAQSTGAEEAALLVSANNVVTVSTRRLESGVTFSGELVPIETVNVNARYDGDLERVYVLEGQAVRKGQPLAIYAERDIRDQLATAEAHFVAAQAALTATENNERRTRKLFEAGAAASRDLEAAEAQRTAAKALLDAATAARNQAQENAEELEVPAPISGWVSHVYVHAGDRTQTGDQLVQIVDTSTLELSATVPSEALPRIVPGAEIEFTVDAFPGEVFTGHIDRVSPTTEPGTRQMRVFMRVPNSSSRLVGGLFATGLVIEQVRENAVSAPVAVLRKEAAEQVVYRVKAGLTQRVVVKQGLLDEQVGMVELVGEVAPGDTLLTGVVPGLRAGERVRVITSAAPVGGEGLGSEAAR